MANLTARQQRLLDALRADSGPVTTGRVRALNSTLGAPKRTTARHDISALQREGLLIEDGTDNDRFYLLTQEQDR
jgi:DNA-binding IclR family transcriptional regulator